uniref:SAC3/GANP/THP3 conserved domain-containing protein n=1 Tax=Encephalitozoon cuniculi TaxID=6035 RepID=M1K309_ENCCN|nr:hypothetical protein ECU04_1260 [Encephalitozoon cuniculi]
MFLMEDLRAKYERLLEARANAKPSENMVGKCMTFCPEFEGLERVLNNDVSPYEAEVMIKKYRKPSSGKHRELPEDVRPVEVLVGVINHVIKLCAGDQSIRMYRFADNGIRAVISDMRIQNEKGKAAIEILEKAARFYIVFRYLLHDHPHFNKDMNLGQLKVVMASLIRLYGLGEAGCKEKDNREEFYCYHILASMGERYVAGIQGWIGGGRGRLPTEITKKYMQNNASGFFRLLRRLDYLAFCLAQSFAGEIRAKSVQMFRKSLAEKVNIEFFGDVLWADESEIEELMKRKGVVVKSGKVDFEEKGGGEEYEKVVPSSRRIETSVKAPIVFMLHGCIDYKISTAILCAVLRKKLEALRLPLGDRHPQDEDRERSAGNRLFAKKMCIAILDEVVRKIAVEVFSRIMLLNTLRRYLTGWKDEAAKRNKNAPVKNRYLLLVVLDREISSVSFMGCINSSVLNTLVPVITYIDKTTVDEMLMYNLCVFSVSKSKREEIYSRYRMINLIADTPQGLSKRVEEIYERAVNALKVRKSTLFAFIDGMDKVQAIEAIVRLIDNGRNGDILEGNLALLYEDKPLVECDIYYEEEGVD